MTLVQIAREEGEVKRVPIGQQPALDLHLKPNQRVIDIKMQQKIAVNRDRVTVDWRYVLYTEWRDPANETEEDTYPPPREETP